MDTIIELNDVHFKYRKEGSWILNNINLKIYPNDWVAVIGPNGSGKSTLAKVINGLLLPESGEIMIEGKILNNETIWDARRAIGMVFQNPDNQFVGATVEDDVAFGLENSGVPRNEMLVRVDEALEKVRMDSFKTKEPSRLSGGQKQRVALASIIALRPKVIILDEATSMLDPLGRIEMIEAIKSLKAEYELTVISITHDIDEASQADRIFVMSHGQLVKQAKPSEIFQLGDELVELGLDIPFAQKLKEELIKLNVDLPEKYMDEEELYQWILKSYLTK